jgi:putative FmdB family regulatory protein
MPLYEYECESCAHRFERIQKFSDPPLETCPVCSGPVRKLLSSPAIQFKGSGWYITDYARKAGTDATAKSGGDSAKPAAASDTKTDSKSTNTKSE